MKIYIGCDDIKISLTDWLRNVEDAVYQFTRNWEYTPLISADKEKVLQDLSKCNLKYLMESRLQFRIENISRVCLAKITREPGIFCSESSATEKLKPEFRIPRNLENDPATRSQVIAVYQKSYESYSILVSLGIPYPDARYVLPDAKTINICYCPTVSEFIRSCGKRINSSYCDEINYVYRRMYWCIKVLAKSNRLWNHICMLIEKSISQGPISDTYGNKFEQNHSLACGEPVNNFWLSWWYSELKVIAENEPELLTDRELDWVKRQGTKTTDWENWEEGGRYAKAQ